MYQFYFEKLEVWKESIDLSTEIYKITHTFPNSEIYGLTSQLRRAAVSISSNLAEGSGRTSKKDQAHFTQISYGSLMEVLNQLLISETLAYINHEQLLRFRTRIEKIANQLNALRKAQLKSI